MRNQMQLYFVWFPTWLMKQCRMSAIFFKNSDKSVFVAWSSCHIVLFLCWVLWHFMLHMTDCALWQKNCLSEFKIISFNALARMILTKMSFIASNDRKHQKRHSAILAMLKNHFAHDQLCPKTKKIFEQIQN